MDSQIKTQKQAKTYSSILGASSASVDVAKQYLNEQEEVSAQLIAKQNNLPTVSLKSYPIASHVLNIIPEDFARKNSVVPYLHVDKTVRVAVLDPKNPEIIKYLEQLSAGSGYEFEMAVTTPASLRYGLAQYNFKTLEEEQIKEIEQLKTEIPKTSLADIGIKLGELNVTEAVDLLFNSAVIAGTSDVHLEPAENELRVRFRIDGVLQDIAKISKAKQDSFISRIKFLAKLKLDIKKTPQDGRFSLKLAGIDVDIRASSIPELYGESIVMRLLIRNGERKGFASLGFEGVTAERISEALTRPFGMILNTGPTGSGKTTTLYAMLDQLNKPDVKIMTLEDPIEYRLPGIVQSQVEADSGYDFAEGLRAILRQDPDVIMVGEIRDAETAKIAVNAAITGHIVLSTLHTNDAPSAMPRILDMGVEPFLLSGAISLIIAQRLVRRICPNCVVKTQINPSLLAGLKVLWETLPKPYKDQYPQGLPLELSYGKGCKDCNGTGFKGQIAIAEAMRVSPEIESRILVKAPVSEIRILAKEQGMVTIEQDGLMKVLKGITTIEEVWRVAKT